MIDWTKPYPLIGGMDLFNKRMFFIERVGYRAPKKGEYYISGAIPEIYKAPNDLTQSHLVVHLVHRAVQKQIWVKEDY